MSSTVLLSPMKRWSLFGALLLALVLSFALQWQWRWRFFAYLPYFLIIVHGLLLALSLRKSTYWSLFKAYWVVPIIVHLLYGLKTIAAFFTISPLAGGAVFLSALPLAPYLYVLDLEPSIQKQEEKLYSQTLDSSASAYKSLFELERPLTRTERTALYQKLQRHSLTADEINRWVERYATDWEPPNETNLRHLLKSPAIDSETLLQFALKNPDNPNLEFIPRNPNAPDAAIEICAKSPHIAVQYAVVSSQRLDKSQTDALLWKMIQQGPRKAGPYVLRTPLATAEMLEPFIELNSRWCSEVVKHPSVTPEQLTKISDHETFWVRRIVAKHSKTPRDTLQKLVNDENAEVSEAARITLSENR